MGRGERGGFVSGGGGGGKGEWQPERAGERQDEDEAGERHGERTER